MEEWIYGTYITAWRFIFLFLRLLPLGTSPSFFNLFVHLLLFPELRKLITTGWDRHLQGRRHRHGHRQRRRHGRRLKGMRRHTDIHSLCVPFSLLASKVQAFHWTPVPAPPCSRHAGRTRHIYSGNPALWEHTLNSCRHVDLHVDLCSPM